MIISKNKNPKIPYPPEVKGYKSSRILKEILLNYLTQENIQPIKQIDNNVRSAILRLKEFLIKHYPEHGVLRKGERGREQFLTEGVIIWLQKRKCSLKNINLAEINQNKS
jgi:hypothetical protein